MLFTGYGDLAYFLFLSSI